MRLPRQQREMTLLKNTTFIPCYPGFSGQNLKFTSCALMKSDPAILHGARGNKWLHPDLVGIQNLSDDWNREIKDCVREYDANKKTKIWSFEVKILINRRNVREVFFQAVSNSSSANFGYLVASEIEGADTLKELRMLASLHGIGFIQLDAENPSESQIMIPARERSEIDRDTANRLTEENKDFLEYVKLIRQFYQTGDLRQSDWNRR